MTVLNIRMSTKEKEELKEIAVQNGESISSYARKVLFQPDNTGDYNDNTIVIQEKDERISDLKSQIDDYKKQIEQLHTIILATQKDNQLLIEQKTKRWWKFWKWGFREQKSPPESERACFWYIQEWKMGSKAI